MRESKFTGAEGAHVDLSNGRDCCRPPKLLLIGLGGGAEITGDTWRKTGARARREAAALGAEEIAILFSPDKDSTTAGGRIGRRRAACQPISSTNIARTHEPPAELKSFTLFSSGLRPTAALMQHRSKSRRSSSAGVFLARDLVNEPPSVTTARFSANRRKHHCRGRGLSVEVWDKRKIEVDEIWPACWR